MNSIWNQYRLVFLEISTNPQSTVGARDEDLDHSVDVVAVEQTHEFFDDFLGIVVQLAGLVIADAVDYDEERGSPREGRNEFVEDGP